MRSLEARAREIGLAVRRRAVAVDLHLGVLPVRGRRAETGAVDVQRFDEPAMRLAVVHAQSAAQAIATLRRSKGMDAVLMFAEEGSVFAVWHAGATEAMTNGRFRKWLVEWHVETGAAVGVTTKAKADPRADDRIQSSSVCGTFIVSHPLSLPPRISGSKPVSSAAFEAPSASGVTHVTTITGRTL